MTSCQRDCLAREQRLPVSGKSGEPNFFFTFRERDAFMDWLQIDGKEIPLLEAPQKYDNPPRRILYVIFKHKKLIRNVFLLLIVPMVLYLLSRPTEYIATSKVLIKPSRAFLSVSPTARGGDDGLACCLPQRCSTRRCRSSRALRLPSAWLRMCHFHTG